MLLPLSINAQDLNDPKYIEELKKKAPLQLINYKKDIVPILDKHCSNCHNPDDDAGGIDFEDLFDPKKAAQHPDLWSMVGKTAKMDVMPPPKKRKRPTAKERELLISWGMQIEHLWDEGKMGKKPGRARLRRLNKNEYNNTIRDLFRIKIRPADNFPEDSAGEGGFDNDADALFLPSLLMENYLEAAVIISDAILNDPSKRRTFLLRATSDQKGAKKVFSYWAPYIYRNKVEEAEINRIVATYKAARAKGKNHLKSMRDGLNMMLISPRFLYRIELPVKGGGKTVKVNDYELANRLSYFLWSSMPDAELFKLASKNQLSDPKTLENQVRRMLKDDRSKTLARHLGGQWLGWDALRGGANPDAKKFLSFALGRELTPYDRPVTKKITDEVIANDGKIQTLIMQIITSEPFLHRQNTSQ